MIFLAVFFSAVASDIDNHFLDSDSLVKNLFTAEDAEGAGYSSEI
jgi:hypothetical protein